MTEQEILKQLGPYRTGPLTITQRLNYEVSGFLNNRYTYEFEYHCKELGISWNTKGWIKSSTPSLNIYFIFEKCNLDVEYLKTTCASLESVPSDKKALKVYLTSYKHGSKTIEVFFKNEDWRRDYWFCKDTTKLNFKFYLKEETRFIIQWSPGSIMLDLTIDGEDASRTFEITELPGTRGNYSYDNLGFTAPEKIREISDYYSQFGFSFHEDDIKEIISILRDGNMCTGVLIKDHNNDQQNSQASGEKSDEFYLAIIGLEAGATIEEIEKARNILVKLFHPDNYAENEQKRVFAEDHFKKINNAYDVLVRRFNER